jgi:hypothetical protein
MVGLEPRQTPGHPQIEGLVRRDADSVCAVGLRRTAAPRSGLASRVEPEVVRLCAVCAGRTSKHAQAGADAYTQGFIERGIISLGIG